MKNIVLFLTAAAMCLASCSVPDDSTDGFIRVDGTDLVCPDGSKFFIKGTNLGFWLNPEGYMFGFEWATSPRMIDQMLCELVGPDRAAEFWKGFKDNFITRDDIAFIASCGANTVRIPFNYRLFTDEDYMGLTSGQDGFFRIDQAIAWCKEFGLHVILDMHDAPGGQTGDNIDDSYGYPWLFESHASQELFYNIWEEIAEHYKDETAVLGYELMNEPIAHFFENKDELNAKYLQVCQEAITRIRAIDNNHIIIVGAVQWNTNFQPLEGWECDENIMFTCHRYGGPAGADYIRDYIGFRDRSGRPMYMGEIGHNTYEWQETYSLAMQDNNIGYTFWPYKKRESSCMMAFDVPSDWDSTVVKFADSARLGLASIRELRPDQETAYRALCEFIENIRFDNCHPQSEYIGSMVLK